MNISRSVLTSIFISTALLAFSTSSIVVGSAAPSKETPSPNDDSDSCCINESNAIIPSGKPAPINDKQRVELKIDTAPDDYSASKLEDEPLLPHSSVSMILDDGQAEDSIGVNSSTAYQFIWLNRFTPESSVFPFYLDQIQVLFWEGMGVSIGDSIDLVVYQDLDGDPPDNATWLATYHSSIKAIDGSNWSIYSLDPPVQLNGPDDVLIGVINRYVDSGLSSPSWPAALDETSTQRRSWVGKWDADPPVPPLLPPDLPPDGYFDLIDGFEFPGNWLIRGYGETLISAPNLITPTNGANIKDNTPEFDWSSVTGATHYKLQVDNDVNFSNPEVDITTSNSTYTLPSALADEKYYWRVQARDGSGIWGIWSSPTWSFTINTISNSFLPISMKEYVSFFEGSWEVEPNDDWKHANGLLQAGKNYYGYPDDDKDYFSFFTTDHGSIVVDLTNHTAQKVQLQLFYQGVNNRVAYVTKPPFHIELSNQLPGLYYIYIYSESGHNKVDNYTLEAYFP